MSVTAVPIRPLKKGSHVIGGTIPTAPDECDGWLATGSRHSVYEDLDWIAATGAFIDKVRAASVPFVGICFGHQLLAHFTGGRTEKAAGWGVGAHDLTTGEPVRLLGNVNRPNSSMSECCQSGLPSAVNAARIPCVPCIYTFPVSSSTVGLDVA